MRKKTDILFTPLCQEFWSHNAAIRNNGKVVSWADTTYGQTNVTAGLSEVKLLAAGGDHTLVSVLELENPILPLTPVNFLVPITNAMPGWQQGYNDGSQVGFGFVFYNTVSLGSAAISFHGPGSSYQPFQGSYFVLLQPNFPSGQVIPAIAQVGTVPNSAQSLRCFAFGSLSVSFANQQIPLSVLNSTPQYTVYGGDISAFAGQTGELRFQGGAFLDNIFFSPEAIPEPSVLGLFALGSLLLGYRSRSKVGM